MAPTFPHVATKNNSSASTPLRGVANIDSPTARLEVTDTGRNNWSYDLPFIPLNIPIRTDFQRYLSLFELIKRHHVDTYDSDENLTTPPETFDATDITAHRGFLLKANLANPGDLYIMNKPTAQSAIIGSSTDYLGQSIVGGTQGSRVLIDQASPTATSAYLDFGATAYAGMPLSPGEALFIEITSASNIYVVPTASGCKLHWLPS